MQLRRASGERPAAAPFARRPGLQGQVSAERQRRSAVIYTLLLMSLLALGVNLVLGDMGLLRYIELKAREGSIETEIYALSRENTRLRARVDEYKKNDFQLEKYAREDFGLTRPGEFIFIFK